VIPGGVSSSNRLIEPNLVFTRADGAYIHDADGRAYLDYHAAFGPPVLGHCHPEVTARVAEALATCDLVGIGANELETQLAERVVAHIPSAEMVMFTNSGSEATYYALRVARAATGRTRIVKFQGCYHGWHDAVLMNIITPADNVGRKHILSDGMHPGVVEDTLVLPFNDIEALEATFADCGDQIAGVILEPIPHNIGCVIPRPDFLAALRDLTTRHGAVLIFDEVITGFRHGLGGYQAICGVTPDLTTLGKAIANGYPLAALCGRAELMQLCAPGGGVFIAGTYNAHPANVAAALATLDVLERPETHRHLFGLGERVRDGLREITARLGVESAVVGFGSVFLLLFMDGPVVRYDDLLRNDADLFVRYRQAMIAQGVYELPVNLKRSHISLAHTETDIDRTLAAAEVSLRAL
jgi:glutamate-1-semialdehyde 2,1-aminomutase